MMNNRTIRPGDKVTWAYISKRPGVVAMTQKCGIVERIHGDNATVRLPSDQTTVVPLVGLMVEGTGKTQLTQFVEAVLEKSQEKCGVAEPEPVKMGE
jgi:hypothetical protein